MERSTSIYLKDGILRVLTQAKTTVGMFTTIEPIFFLQANDHPQEIGLKALESLNHFKEKIPHPKNQEEFKIRDIEFNQAMQIKSWRTFMKNAKLLDLRMEKNNIIIMPCRNLGPREGFEEIIQKSRTSSPIPEELGRAILDAFNDCD